MLTVLPEKDEKTIKEYFNKSGLTADGDSHLVIAKSADGILGYCAFCIKDGTVYILDIEPKDDIPLFDGILRSALHVASNAFIFKAEYKNEKLHDNLKTLGFILDEKKNTVNIDKLFGGCNCGGCK